MMAKVNAAWECARRACPCVITNGRGLDSILKVVAGQEIGTLFSMDGAARFEESESEKAGMSLSNRDMALRARDASRALTTLDEGDAAMTEADKVFDGEVGAGDVVVCHAVAGVVGGVAVEHDHGHRYGRRGRHG
jgi:glutamate 5-kinase